MASRYKKAYWEYRKTRKLDSLVPMLPMNPVGDHLFSVYQYWHLFKRLPNLRAPKRFSEHLLKLKLSSDGQSALRCRISDKEFVKDYVRETLGDGFTAKTFAVLHSKTEARSFVYPSTCVIKATHDSGGVIIRKSDDQPVDTDRVSSWFDDNYYERMREVNYRDLKPKVIVEELLSERGHDTPRDYKVFCFQGKPAFVQVDSDRFTGHTRSLFSPRWRELDFEMEFPRNPDPPGRPANLDDMLELSARLSADFSFIRVDFFQLDDRVVIGELTNIPAAACLWFTPDEADILAGRLFTDPAADVETLLGVRAVGST